VKKCLLLGLVIVILAATMVLIGCQSTPTTSVTEDELTKLEGKITALEGMLSEQPSTGVYDRVSYELITVRPEGNEASFSIRPNQHYSIVFFLGDPPDRDTTVYQTFIPAEAKDNIWVYYTKPLDDHTGVSIGPGRHTFAMLAYFEGWYTIDYYYDVPEGMLASSMSEIGIYVRWVIGG